MEVLAAAAAIVAIGTAAVKLGGWTVAKWRARRALPSGEPGALATGPSPYPVRLTCGEHTEFRPSSGYREGLVFIAFNHSDKPVTIKGFGLDVTLSDRLGQEWHDYVQATVHPPRDRPIRLEPNDGVEGAIDTEALADDYYGERDQVSGWRPYVDVLGYGIEHVEVSGAPVGSP